MCSTGSGSLGLPQEADGASLEYPRGAGASVGSADDPKNVLYILLRKLGDLLGLTGALPDWDASRSRAVLMAGGSAKPLSVAVGPVSLRAEDC